MLSLKTGSCQSRGNWKNAGCRCTWTLVCVKTGTGKTAHWERVRSALTRSPWGAWSLASMARQSLKQSRTLSLQFSKVSRLPACCMLIAALGWRCHGVAVRQRPQPDLLLTGQLKGAVFSDCLPS